MTFVNVSAGQSLSGITIASGDTYEVQSGGSVSNATVNGFLVVEGGGQVSATTVGTGFLEIESGGRATGTVVSGGFDEVFSGGTATSTTVLSRGYEEVFGGVSNQLSVLSGGYVYLSSGVLNSATLASGVEVMAVSAGQVVNPTLQQGASLDLEYIPYASGGSATLNTATDVLTIAEGGTATTFQLAGSYAGDSFSLQSDYAFPTFGKGTPGTIIQVVPAGSQSTTTFGAVTTITTGSNPVQIVTGSTANQVVTAPHTIQVPTGAGFSYVETTGTAVQMALAQQVLALASNTALTQTLYIAGATQIGQSVTLSQPYLLDLPQVYNSIAGNSAVPYADILLASSASYVTGGTAVSTVVAVDGAASTIVNNQAGDALLAATGAAGNTLEGLAGANQFFTGTGGADAVLLNGFANNLTTNGSDAVLVGGPSTITAASGGLDNAVMTSGTVLAFVNQSTNAATDSITGAANGVVLLAGTGNTAITAGTGPEFFFVDSSAGNTTLTGAAGSADAFTFIKDANAGAAHVQVANFTTADVVALHGYTAFNVQATTGGAVLALSDGSQVTFANTAVAAVQQAIRVT